MESDNFAISCWIIWSKKHMLHRCGHLSFASTKRNHTILRTHLWWMTWLYLEKYKSLVFVFFFFYYFQTNCFVLSFKKVKKRSFSWFVRLKLIINTIKKRKVHMVNAQEIKKKTWENDSFLKAIFFLKHTFTFDKIPHFNLKENDTS